MEAGKGERILALVQALILLRKKIIGKSNANGPLALYATAVGVGCLAIQAKTPVCRFITAIVILPCARL